MNIKLSNDDFYEIDKELCSRSLAEFVKQSWHILEPSTPLVWGWHMEAVCEHLEAITNGDIKRLLINIPPGTSKSSLANIYWPAWEWGACGLPSTRIIGASHMQDLATRDTRKMRNLIMSSWYQERWGVELTGDQNQKTYFENENTGFRQACAVSSMTGRRGDRVIWDDPHSTEAAYSDVQRETALRVFRETLPTRLNDPINSAIVVIMQRLHEEDVAGYILSNELGYEHLMIPMEFEQNRKCYTSIGWSDPRTKEGELLLPERFPQDVVDRDKKAMGARAAAAQFQQTPAPSEGNIININWFNYYDRIEGGEIFQSWDTANKDGEENDYSACTTWLVKDSCYYLLDVYKEKLQFPDLVVALKKQYEKWKPRSIVIEDKASGQQLLQTLRRETKLPIVAYNPKQMSKAERMNTASIDVEAGRVYLKNKAVWLEELLHELKVFPNGKYKDTGDSFSMFINWYKSKRKTFNIASF
jgi:predicted phage terminase large subunit-like protein